MHPIHTYFEAEHVWPSQNSSTISSSCIVQSKATSTHLLLPDLLHEIRNFELLHQGRVLARHVIPQRRVSLIDHRPSTCEGETRETEGHRGENEMGIDKGVWRRRSKHG